MISITAAAVILLMVGNIVAIRADWAGRRNDLNIVAVLLNLACFLLFLRLLGYGS